MPDWSRQLYLEQADRFATFLDRRFEEASEEIGELRTLLATEHECHPEAVLDVACGIGRHVVGFAEAGRAATGVDIPAPFIERARERTAEAGVADRPEFRVGDMREAGAWDGECDLV